MNSTNIVNIGMSFPMSYRISVEKAIGITTTVPIEIVYAAGYVPIDLNNIFICNDDSDALVDYAEIKGLPRNTCAWIKGHILRNKEDRNKENHRCCPGRL